MSRKTQKIVAAVAAMALAASIMLGGTLAWQSINQEATNIVAETINPGGRLHDDFDGENKDIYVENFADVPIYARIQLREYLELGSDLPGTGDLFIPAAAETFHDATAPGAVDTWAIHYFDETKNVTDNYVDFTWGGSTTYMPTFNMNKDSLEADINGTYEGLYTDGTEATNGTTLEADRYADHIDYSDPQYAVGSTGLAGTEIRDIDTNDIDEYATAGTGSVGTNWSETPNTHYASETRTATVISMADWQAMDPADQAIFYGWVYDTDGWAYWSQPIEPKEVDTTTGEVTSKNTTGLLLDAITPRIDDNFYYQIHVIAQFITANDLGHTDGTGFFEAGKGTEPSADALALLNTIGVDITGGSDLTLTTADATAKRGGTVTFSAAGTDGTAVTGATWLVNGSNVAATMSTGLQTVTAVADGTLTISKNETASTLTVIAIAEKTTTDNDGNVTATDTLIGSYEVRLVDTYDITITAADNAATVYLGDPLQFTAAVTKNGAADTSAVTWSVTKATGVSLSDDGVLTIDETATHGETLTITATLNADDSVSAEYTITIDNGYKTLKTAAAESKVMIDGTEWWVVVKEDNRALLWATEPVGGARAFDADSGVWEGSDMQIYLNGAYLDTLPTLSRYAWKTAITTAEDYSHASFTTTEDKVFLLSEADVFGTYHNGSADGVAATDERDYTYVASGTAPTVIVTEAMKTWGTEGAAWLRSPRTAAGVVALIGYDGAQTCDAYHINKWLVRPAMWVRLGDIYEVEVTAAGDATTIAGGKTLQFSASITKNGELYTPSSIEWTVDAGTTGSAIDADTGLLTAGTTTGEVTVKATVAGVTGECKVSVTLTETQQNIVNAQAGETVDINGTDYYVVLKDTSNGQNRALLWATVPVAIDGGTTAVAVVYNASDNLWSTSSVRTTLNGETFMNSLGEIKNDIIPTDISTATEHDRADYETTTDSIFLLSQADVFGQAWNGSADADTADSREYTFGTSQIVADSMKGWTVTSGTRYAWLRSPRGSTDGVAMVASGGAVTVGKYTYSNFVRPAFWVNLAS